MPSDAGLRTDPGTAMTGTPRDPASETVSNEPPRTRDSTTTTASASAAMMRLRAGNRWAAGGGARWHLRAEQAHARPTSSQRPALQRG